MQNYLTAGHQSSDETIVPDVSLDSEQSYTIIMLIGIEKDKAVPKEMQMSTCTFNSIIMMKVSLLSK